MTDKELIVCYRDTVILLCAIRKQIKWNNSYCLPVQKLIKDEERLINDLLWFEDVLDRIEDIQTKNVIRCRFVLGMSIEATAEYLNTSTLTINRLTGNAWSIIKRISKTNTG